MTELGELYEISWVGDDLVAFLECAWLGFARGMRRDRVVLAPFEYEAVTRDGKPGFRAWAKVAGVKA